MRFMVNKIQFVLVAVSLVAGCCGKAQNSSGIKDALTNGLLLTIEYSGPEAGRPWYRVGFASSGQEHQLLAWRQKHSIMADYYLIGVLSEEALSKIRRFLAQPGLVNRRTQTHPREMPQYVMHIAEGDKTFYLPIGFSADTLHTLKSLESLLDGKCAASLSRLANRISFLDVRQQHKARRGEEGGTTEGR